MENLVKRISTIFALLSAVLIAVITFSTLIDVLSRFMFKGSVRGVVELSEVFLVAIVFLGMAYTQLTKAHVRMEVLQYIVSEKTLNFLRMIGMLLLAIITVLLVLATGKAFLDSFISGEYRTGLLSIPLWPAKLIVALGLLVLLMNVLIELTNQVKITFHSKLKNDGTKE